MEQLYAKSPGANPLMQRAATLVQQAVSDGVVLRTYTDFRDRSDGHDMRKRSTARSLTTGLLAWATLGVGDAAAAGVR